MLLKSLPQLAFISARKSSDPPSSKFIRRKFIVPFLSPFRPRASTTFLSRSSLPPLRLGVTARAAKFSTFWQRRKESPSPSRGRNLEVMAPSGLSLSASNSSRKTILARDSLGVLAQKAWLSWCRFNLRLWLFWVDFRLYFLEGVVLLDSVMDSSLQWGRFISLLIKIL